MDIMAPHDLSRKSINDGYHHRPKNRSEDGSSNSDDELDDLERRKLLPSSYNNSSSNSNNNHNEPKKNRRIQRADCDAHRHNTVKMTLPRVEVVVDRRRQNEKQKSFRKVRRAMSRLLLVILCFSLASFTVTFGLHPSTGDKVAAAFTKEVTYQQTMMDNNKTIVFSALLKNSTEPISVFRWTQLMMHSEKYMATWIKALQDAPFSAYFFETKGVSKNSWNKSFEFVLMDAPELYDSEQGDPFAFGDNIQCENAEYTCSFLNLGEDALLVSPKLVDHHVSSAAYSHVAAFCRKAPEKHVISFWRNVARLYREQLELTGQSIWLNTDGRGVAWLHMRLDRRPKYYKFLKFKEET